MLQNNANKTSVVLVSDMLNSLNAELLRQRALILLFQAITGQTAILRRQVVTGCCVIQGAMQMGADRLLSGILL